VVILDQHNGEDNWSRGCPMCHPNLFDSSIIISIYVHRDEILSHLASLEINQHICLVA
jgi:hypothetical protein